MISIVCGGDETNAQNAAHRRLLSTNVIQICVGSVFCLLSEDQLAERARWRDNRLMALAAHQRAQPD